MRKISGSQVNGYRILFLIATAALFTPILALYVIVQRDVPSWYHWAFWLLAGLGGALALVWFLLLGCRRESMARDESGLEPVVHRLFDQLTPLLLMFAWFMIMHAWADRTWPTPPLSYAKLGAAVGVPLVAGALWARYGSGPVTRLTGRAFKGPSGRRPASDGGGT